MAYKGSYVAYKKEYNVLLNPTNAVGGSFIPSLTSARIYFPTGQSQTDMNNPPTALVGFGTPPSVPCRLGMKAPPTSLVGLHPNTL